MSHTGGHISFLLKHSTIYGIGNLLSKVVAFLLLPLYTRYLSPESYGILELVDVTIGMIGIVVGVGVTEALSRFYYDQKDGAERRAVISTGYGVVTAMAVVSVLVLSYGSELFAVLILESAGHATLFTISFLSLGLGIITDVAQVYFRLLHKSTHYIAISLANLIIGVLLNILFIAYLEYGVIGIFYASLLTRLLVGVPVTVYVLKKVGIRFQWSLAKEMVAFSVPLIPAALASTAVAYSDRYFINYFLTLAETGIYGLGRKIGSMIHLLITVPFLLVFLPRRFEIAHEEGAKEVFGQVFYYYLLTMLFIGLGLSVMADIVIAMMTTTEFYPAADFVPLAVLTMIILGAKYHFEFGILYSKKTRYYMYIYMVSGGVHLASNWFFVKAIGLWGAMYASLLAQLLTTGLVYLVGQRLFPINFGLWKSLKALVAACAIYAVSTYPLHLDTGLMIVYKFMLVASFPVVLAIFGLISKDEIFRAKQFSQVFARKLRK